MRAPGPDDHKYSRGLLGVVTGSVAYPGAAVLTVSAAIRCGAGMVRYVGDRRVAGLVLQRRPEAVLAERVDVGRRPSAWLLGSGTAPGDEGRASEMRDALAQGLPTVLDAGGLELLADPAVRGSLHGRVIVTPHVGEMARILVALGEDGALGEAAALGLVRRDPAGVAARVSGALGVTVVLKGHTTHVASPEGVGFVLRGAPSWLASAGTGDVLAGISGALLAINRDEDPARVAAGAVALHGLAAIEAAQGGPIAALDVAEAVPRAIARVLSQ